MPIIDNMGKHRAMARKIGLGTAEDETRRREREHRAEFITKGREW